MSESFTGTPVKANLAACSCGGKATLRQITNEWPDPGSEWVRCTRCKRITDIYPRGNGDAVAEWQRMSDPAEATEEPEEPGD